MKLDDFLKFVYTLKVDDYVVRLKLKYDHENTYHYSNELLLYDGSDYYWDNDWDEGQQYVEVVGFIPTSEIAFFYNPDIKQNNIFKCGNCNHLIFKNYKYEEGYCDQVRMYRNFADRCLHEEEMK